MKILREGLWLAGEMQRVTSLERRDAGQVQADIHECVISL